MSLIPFAKPFKINVVKLDSSAGNSPAPPMSAPRVYHSATFILGPDGRVRTGDDEVVVVGGLGGSALPLPTAEVLHPEPAGKVQ